MSDAKLETIRPGDWHAQPWKNGGGTTYEIAREDDEHGFTWRLSLAHVEADGPFSRFPGVDRTIALVEGDGFTLRRAGEHLVTLTEPLVPFAFSGDDALDCTLVGGPVRDLNLMVRRKGWRATTQTHALGKREALLLAPAVRTLLFVASGALDAGSAIAGSRPRDTTLGRHETAVLREHAPLRLAAAGDGAQLFVATLASR